jgi:hypothetical protein
MARNFQGQFDNPDTAYALATKLLQRKRYAKSAHWSVPRGYFTNTETPDAIIGCEGGTFPWRVKRSEMKTAEGFASEKGRE